MTEEISTWKELVEKANRKMDSAVEYASDCNIISSVWKLVDAGRDYQFAMVVEPGRDTEITRDWLNKMDEVAKKIHKVLEENCSCKLK